MVFVNIVIVLRGRYLMNNILYSSHCPRCQVLEKKLDKKNICYDVVDDMNEMRALGIKSTPVLVIGNKMLPFMEAIQWVNEQ